MGVLREKSKGRDKGRGKRDEYIIEWVGQEQRFGCSIACIAMILGKKYWEVESKFSVDFNLEGLAGIDVARYISTEGWSCIKVEPIYQSSTKCFHGYLLKPFADAHIISFDQFFFTDKEAKEEKNIGHQVVMDNRGRIFNPSDEKNRKMSEHYCINYILGFYKDNGVRLNSLGAQT